MTITIRQLNKTEPPIRIVFYFAAIGTIFFGTLTALFFWVTPNLHELAGLAVVGLIVAISAFYSIRRLLPRRRRDSGCGTCPAHYKHK